jgi:hypothetical protein
VGQPVGYHPGTSREERLAEQMELLAVESSQCKVYTQERIKITNRKYDGLFLIQHLSGFKLPTRST